MFRLVGLLIAIGLIAWLSLKQFDGAGRSASQAAVEASRVAGVENAVELDPNGSPRDVAAQVGRQVEATIAASKTRVDDFEREAGGSATRADDPSDAQ
jgi:hypothetical protein